MKGYNVSVAIISALESCSISRLKKSWETINQKEFEELKEFFSPKENYKNYREEIQSDSIFLPFLGFFFTFFFNFFFFFLFFLFFSYFFFILN